MISREQKEKIVADLSDKIGKQKITLFADCRGVEVGKVSVFRRELKKNEADYKVAKKSLIQRALKEKNYDADIKGMEGQIGVIFGYKDEVSAAKTAYNFARLNESFKILGGILGSRILSKEDTVALAKLPSYEVMLAKTVCTVAAPLSGLVNVLQGNIRGLVNVLNAVKSKK